MKINKNANKLLAKILMDHDPLKLIAGGAPENEYSLEIDQILELIKRSGNVGDLANRLFLFYNQLLSKSEVVGNRLIYKNMAKEIYQTIVES